MEPRFSCSHDPLERLLGIPGDEVDALTEVVVQAWRLAERGELAEGYTLLLRHASQAAEDAVQADWQRRLLSLWERALDYYCTLYGVRW